MRHRNLTSVVMVSPIARAFALAIALAFGLVAGGSGAGADETGPAALGKATKAFKQAMKSKISEARSAAFQHLRNVRDPEVMNLIVDGVETLKKARRKIGKAQEEAQEEYAKQINAQKALDQRWESSKKTASDMKAFNRRETKIAKARDAAFNRLHTLENDFTRNEAMIQSASTVAAHILSAMEPEVRKTAATTLGNRWLESTDSTDHVRWIYAVWMIEDPWIAKRLHEILANPASIPGVRAAALNALASRDDPKVAGVAEEFLKASPEDFTLIAGTIASLRRLHRPSSIVPLIDFLAREDIARLRGDAHLALKSLTGETHGPYADPWRKWWEANKETFRMPTAPSTSQRLNAPKKGVTFYGIHTFSDRILFIVDISGSMSHSNKKDKALTKMDVARKELSGAVQSLDERARFAVIFFNHQILRWQQGIQEATEPNKKKVVAWINDTQEVGGTNIYDALEAGFAIAMAGSRRPELDTIYFLTDGKPTAGKFQDGERILNLVRSWNRTANLKIHVVGIGADHDMEFCKELAAIGDGQYVKR